MWTGAESAVTYNLRVFGWLLIVMGVVFGGVTTLSMLGAFPLTVEVLDFKVTGTRARLIFVASCGACALLGGGLVLWARRRVELASRSAT